MYSRKSLEQSASLKEQALVRLQGSPQDFLIHLALLSWASMCT